MKIFIVCSKYFYDKVESIKNHLENSGHKIQVPNSFDSPFKEEEMKRLGKEEHIKWKQKMLKKDEENIEANDAILVLNFEKNGQKNYIGGATFMEIIKAWERSKKIFLYNDIPENIFKDELTAINPIIINGNLSKIQDKKIEVEIQSFITKDEYEKLIYFFNENAEFIKEDFQETYYFDENSNLRIQRNNKGAKLWHKSGNVHDQFMEEIEIEAKREDFEKLEKFLNKLGHEVKIKWFRTRKQYNWDGIKVCLDYTRNYGYIIELEKITSDSLKRDVLDLLKSKFYELGIQETPKEIFNEKYEYYINNWEEMIGNAMD